MLPLLKPSGASALNESPFAIPRPRPLRVVVDTVSIPEEDADALGLVLEFARSPLLEVLATKSPVGGVIEIPSLEPTHYDAIPISYRTGVSGALTNTGLAGAAGLLARASNAAAELGLDEQDTQRAAVLARASETSALCADVFISGRQLFWDRHPELPTSDLNLMTSRQGLAMIGLYLRSHNDFHVNYEARLSNSWPSDDFYRICATDMLAGWLPFVSGCIGAATLPEYDDAVQGLAESILMRTQRALMARDRLQRNLYLKPSNQTTAEVLFYFDSALLMMSGAFDAAARLAQQILLGKTSANVSWKFWKWRNKIVDTDPAFAALLAENSSVRTIIELVGWLRNFVHEQALSNVTYVAGGTEHFPANMVVFSGVRRVEFLKHMSGSFEQASLDDWGVALWSDRWALLDPGMFIERLIPVATVALSTLMATINPGRVGSDPAFDVANYVEVMMRIPQPHLRNARLLLGL